MPRLSEKQLLAVESELDRANSQPSPIPAVNAFVAKYSNISARVEFPLGELTNEKIGGYIWAWNLQRKIKTAGIENGDRFNAQGLEGKVSVEVEFLTAFNVWRDLPKFRCNVYVYSDLRMAK